MLYAQDTTKFSAVPDATEHGEIYLKCPVTARRVQEEWHDNNCDIVFGESLKTALICNSGFVKLIVGRDKSIQAHSVDPEMFGVLTENVPFLDRQQAFVMLFSISQSALATELQYHPRKDAILSQVSASQTSDKRRESGIDRILISSAPASPTLTGQAILPWIDVQDPQPGSDEPMIQMYELYVWNDEIDDYQVVTVADPQIVVYDRPCEEMFLKGEHPFIQICPNPKSGNFRGESETNRLRGLQDLLNERMQQIRVMMARQAKPPIVGSNIMGPQDEIALSLQSAGDFIQAEQGFNFKEVSPNIPADLLQDVDRIRAYFDITSGLTATLQGNGNGRSGGQEADRARLGSTRIRNRALIVEDALEGAATKIFKLLRRYSADLLVDAKGNEFLLAQMPKDMVIKVDAHSSSPTFAEDTKQLAFALHKEGVADGEDVIRMTNPPAADEMAYKYNQRQAAAAKERQDKIAHGIDPDHPTKHKS